MNYIWMTILSFLFIFVMTSLGALMVVFMKRNMSQKTTSVCLGFASGVMVASSIWSLIMPSIEGANKWGTWAFVPAAVGIMLGSAFLLILERIVPHNDDEMLDKSKCVKLFIAMTVHNIPEGMAVGFAFGTAYFLGTDAAYLLAAGLAFGIGIQNFPEGAAVALPIKGVMNSRAKGVFYGVASGIVEPIFAIVGYFLATAISALQPWLLAFAAGAMLHVVASDLLPDAREMGGVYASSISFIMGFIVMMTLDVALG